MFYRRTESSRFDCTLIVIARDEAPYIIEWLAFHRAVGFSRILVFDHGSTDDTPVLVARAAAADPAISLHAIPILLEASPQIAAYTAGMALVRTPWVAFLDVDEFLVPWRDGSLSNYLARVPEDVSAVHINWRSFGSSGLATPGYAFVTEAFTRCAPPDWAYQTHYKTLARSEHVHAVQVHEVILTAGRRTLSDFTDVAADATGMADRIAYDGIQLNHYQCKTRVEFMARMHLPSAGNPRGPRLNDMALRYSLLDRNEVEDRSASLFHAAMRERWTVLSRPRGPLRARAAAARVWSRLIGRGFDATNLAA
ncbi:Glycosyl transferase family 2 [Methylobacterium phyllostachyos]|uniref:Glycosyl transferase family 2 n=1 Tax=Methylobacterium phyllostachyos TaxID=582672 RepID=A0A1H0C545_9HYPH|nr:glycosyltransferase family 2 protein [Methylobacterium phyllostachyos]SDN52990.1 Glycosyl transferase family 2 [Methylobacterium phyllostachyos]